MVTAVRTESWNQTSQILAMLWNVNQTKKNGQREPWTFNIFAKKAETPKVGIQCLKVFLKKR